MLVSPSPRMLLSLMPLRRIEAGASRDGGAVALTIASRAAADASASAFKRARLLLTPPPPERAAPRPARSPRFLDAARVGGRPTTPEEQLEREAAIATLLLPAPRSVLATPPRGSKGEEEGDREASAAAPPPRPRGRRRAPEAAAEAEAPL